MTPVLRTHSNSVRLACGRGPAPPPLQFGCGRGPSTFEGVMGKASSSKKVARAARTGGGRTRRGSTSWLWPTLMAVIVLLGTAGVVYSREQRQPDTSRPVASGPGRPGDHWHAAIGFYVCGQFQPNISEAADPLGIHTHADGIVHVHPFASRSAGKNAKLGVFFDTVNA